MVATTMKSPQPFLSELQQRHGNPSMVQSRSSFGNSEEVPFARGVKLQNDEPHAMMMRQSLRLDDLAASKPSMMHLPVGPLAVNSGRQESTSSEEFDGSVISNDSSMGLGFYDSDSSLLSPSKLYGREKEIQTLSQAYQRIVEGRLPSNQVEYVLISGAVGSGKTRLGESLRQNVTSDGGFFCYGKFDQFGMTHPLQPLCEAFTDYVEQVLARDEIVKKEVRHRIRAAVDGDLTAIYKMIPPLATLMNLPACEGGCPLAPSHQDGNKQEEKEDQEAKCDRDCKAKAHSMFAMQRLMRAISTPERPVVMMFDDLQWAPPTALEKMKKMITDDLNDGIMFVGTCLDDVSPTSPLSTMLRWIESQRVLISNVALKNLRLDTVVTMADDAFVMAEEQAKALGKYIWENSAGNPYLVLESLRAIRQNPGLMQYDSESEKWIMNVKACCSTGCCPVNFVESKLRVLPRDMQKVFMVASCLGSNITPRLVEIALQEDVDARFDKLVKRGKFVFDKNKQTYSFRQNAVQEASYRLIDESIREGFHLEIGLRLWRHLDKSEVDDNLFVIVDQIKRGVALADQALRYELTDLVIRAATKAVSTFNFHCASHYLKFAFTLLGPNHWTEAYDLSVILYNYAAEIEFAYADSDRVDEYLNAVFENARECSDKIRAYTTKVYVLGGRGKMSEAIATGLCILENLGVHIPKHCNKLSTTLAMARISRRLSGMSNERIKRMKHMTHPNKLAVMQILNLLFLNTNISRKDLFPFIVLKMMKLTLADGLSAISSVAFAGYGSLLCFAGNVNEGLRYGKLAMDLVEDFDAVSFKSRCNAMVWGTIYPHVRKWNESLEHLKEGHRVGLQTGDVEFAMLNANLYILSMVESGSFPMKEMIAQTSKVAELTELHGLSKQMGMLRPMLSAFELLANPDVDLLDHSGPLDDGLRAAEASGNLFAAPILYVSKEFMYFIAGDYDSALETMERRLDKFSRIEGSVQESFAYYLEGLVAFASIREKKSGHETRKLRKHATRCMRYLKLLAQNNPSTCLSKYLLLEAEEAALKKKYPIAREKYAHAVALAKSNGSFIELAFANQVAATHFQQDVRDIDSALTYFRAAQETYSTWGAHAPVALLKPKIDDLARLNV